MAEIRLSKLTKQFSIGLQTLVDFLKEKGAEVEMNPNAKISDSYLPAIEAKFGDDQKLKQDSEKVAIKLKEIIEMGAKKKTPEDDADNIVKEVIIKSNLSSETPAAQPVQQNHAEAEPVAEVKETPAETAEEKPAEKHDHEEKTIGNLKILGEIDLSQFDRKPKARETKPAEEKIQPAIQEQPHEPESEKTSADVREVPAETHEKKEAAPAKPKAESKATEAKKPALETVKPVAEEPAAPKAVTSRPKETRKATPAPKAVAKAPKTSVSPRMYHIIIASVGTTKDAESMARSLRNKGYAHAQAIIGGGKMRVCIDSYANEAEAYSALNRFRKDKNYQNAWILKKK